MNISKGEQLFEITMKEAKFHVIIKFDFTNIMSVLVAIQSVALFFFSSLSAFKDGLEHHKIVTFFLPILGKASDLSILIT